MMTMPTMIQPYTGMSDSRGTRFRCKRWGTLPLPKGYTRAVASGRESAPVGASVAVLLPQPRTQPQHELDPLKLVEPVSERGGRLLGVRHRQPHRAGRAQLLAGH